MTLDASPASRGVPATKGRALQTKRFESRWGRKSYFLATRALVLPINFICGLLLIRVLSLTDYGLIGLVESTTGLLATMLSLGITESLARELAYERDAALGRRLVVTAYVFTAVADVATILLTITAAAFSQWLFPE